ncbi:MAG TPA: TetR family transcriptional regulator [Pseudonocardia sp.]|jgi:DNA-binding transcriptional regulator YbjK|nr:TetR family transcriptional regulator [Pseudonocardia sp.]
MPEAELDAEPAELDGRRRRGSRRRRALLDAALRVIGRDGLAAVSQRAVAVAAGLPASAVYYYFATIDELVVAVLVDTNDRLLAELAALPAGPAALATWTVDCTRRHPEEVRAELELWVLGTRRPDLRGELDRWDAGLRAAAARLTADPVAVDAVVAAVNGYCWQAVGDDRYTADRLAAILRHILRAAPVAPD